MSGTDQIIAVAEFYQRTDDLDKEIGLSEAQQLAGGRPAILLMYLLLSGFVRRASNTITHAAARAGRKVNQLTELLAQNQELHERVRRAAASVALLNEGYLRRVGSELHDGPAQDLGLSLLKLDALPGGWKRARRKPIDPMDLDQLAKIADLAAERAEGNARHRRRAEPAAADRAEPAGNGRSGWCAPTNAAPGRRWRWSWGSCPSRSAAAA